MSLPDDIEKVIKFIKESRATLAAFIDTAGKLGMPVRMLRKVQDQYTIKFEFGSGTDHVEPFWNNLVLYEDTVQGLKRSGKRPISDISVQTLYHEATHAVIDIDDIDDTYMFDNAMIEFKRAKLTNGKLVSDTERVAQEAAGCYVGHRAATAWGVWQMMVNLNGVMDDVEINKITAGRGQELINLFTRDAGIPGYYEREMRRRVFGYQDVGSRQIYVADYPIPQQLQAYSDGVLLENAIRDTFADMGPYQPVYERLKARLAKLGLKEKP